jgi:hypothetical protein
LVSEETTVKKELAIAKKVTDRRSWGIFGDQVELFELRKKTSK